MSEWRSRITAEPGKRSGQPTVRGMKIAVADVLLMLAHGRSEDDILSDFPELERADISACLSAGAHLAETPPPRLAFFRAEEPSEDARTITFTAEEFRNLSDEARAKSFDELYREQHFAHDAAE